MKKRLLALLLVLTMVFSLMPAALAADTVDVAALPEYAADADISTGAAYKISTEESLRAFAAAVKADDGNGTYAHAGVTLYLAGDIALTGTWTPVGSTATYVGDFFAGTFDGCGHTISGLNVQGSKVNQGLFAAINKATIRNLNVSGTVSCGTKNYVGGIVGKVQAGTIENCSFSGSVTGGLYRRHCRRPEQQQRDHQRLRERGRCDRNNGRRYPWLLENDCSHSKLLQYRQRYRFGQGGRYCRPAEQGHY